MNKLKQAASKLLQIFLVGVSSLLLFNEASATKDAALAGYSNQLVKQNISSFDASQKEVLEKCVSFTELQQYLPKNAAGTYKQLIVMQHAVSFEGDNGASHSGQTILYKGKADIKNGGVDAYFYFHTFTIDQNAAKAEFTFYYDQTTAAPKMAVVELALTKSANGWAIANSKINIQ